ncbi:tetratricopeptide repeat-containing glycosyltransferase family protein [Methylovorus menthalis]|uniref:tetratricopeptide repeat-containing glycosyltransferase family protein n=1 Tax=Methylovorus menthalis TaxID=1002227 RepID=UPI001E42F32A|nr:tetratricopeptide repeat-containing glycosyltransferase family protein [Methylovorus menthalis]MCB4810669.1 tetratricopeptide repeat-containing glycosyltransferase family protein [Methylovorus menthalis]
MSTSSTPSNQKKNAGAGELASLVKRADQALAQGHYKLALEQYNHMLALQADNLAALVGCGRALTSLKQYEFAIAHLDYALAAAPQDAAIHHYRGLALQKARRFDEAIVALQTAIELQPDQPALYLNLANTLADAGDVELALAFYDQIIAQYPSALAFNNRGNLHLDQGRFALAMQDFTEAITRQPDQPRFFWNKALLHLLLGEYAQGWALYEYGFHTEGEARGLMRRFDQPRWLGDTPLAGKRLLLWAEQGYGDTIQFCRYALDAMAQGAEVILEVQAPLKALMHSLHPAVQVVAAGEHLPAFDLHSPLLSMPLAWIKAGVSTLPTHTAYLKADKTRKATFQLAPPGKLRVGVVWSGSTTHSNDHRRSLLLQNLQAWRDLSIELHCLQLDVREVDLPTLADWPEMHLHTGALKDFSDTAALISAMDVVISVDTSVAHLAGALGKPVWVLLPWIPDFRWLLDRVDSPWYPTARLYRQPVAGDWASVVQQVMLDLQALGSQPEAPTQE